MRHARACCPHSRQETRRPEQSPPPRQMRATIALQTESPTKHRRHAPRDHATAQPAWTRQSPSSGVACGESPPRWPLRDSARPIPRRRAESSKALRSPRASSDQCAGGIRRCPPLRCGPVVGSFARDPFSKRRAAAIVPPRSSTSRPSSPPNVVRTARCVLSRAASVCSRQALHESHSSRARFVRTLAGPSQSASRRSCKRRRSVSLCRAAAAPRSRSAHVSRTRLRNL